MNTELPAFLISRAPGRHFPTGLNFSLRISCVNMVGQEGFCPGFPEVKLYPLDSHICCTALSDVCVVSRQDLVSLCGTGSDSAEIHRCWLINCEKTLTLV